MSGTRELLGKIAALRQRLDQAQGLAHEAGTAAVSMLDHHGEGLAQLWALEEKVNQGQEQARILEEVLPAIPDEKPIFPKQLLSRAHRAIQRGRELLGELRNLSEEPLLQDKHWPGTRLYRETTALTDTTLRMIQRFPDSPSAQIPLCEGIDVILKEIAERLHRIQSMVQRRRSRLERVLCLKEWLLAAERGEAVECKVLGELASELLNEAKRGAPLTFHEASPVSQPNQDWVAEHVACHGLVVAQVLARIVTEDPKLKDGATEAVCAALVHDIGMLRVAPKIVAKREALDVAERRELESHCFQGAEILRQVMPHSVALIEVAHHHHELGQGAGYPEGRKADTIAHLTQMVSVCDVYAACCVARPHRRALGPRTAMTEVLLLAEKGALDRRAAEYLLHLGFYPVGTVVELSEGALGMVIGSPRGADELSAPAKPIITVLTDEKREPLIPPRIVDLSQSPKDRIIRSLEAEERQRALSHSHPEWA